MATMQEPETVIKAGWLHKKGGGKRRANWKTRYFVLSKEKLDYFEDNKMSCLKGTIPIDGSVVTFNVVPFSEKKHAFVISLPSRDFVIQASSDTEMNSWIQNILETYLARKKDEEEQEKRKKMIMRSRSSMRDLMENEGNQKMVEAQIRFEELFRFDEARIRKEGLLKKLSSKEGVTKPLSARKQGMMRGSSRSLVESSRHCYCVLTLTQLTIFENSEKKNIEGNIDLRLVQDVVALPDSQRDFLLCLPTETYTVGAGHDRDRQEWIDAIKDCLDTLKEKAAMAKSGQETETDPLLTVKGSSDVKSWNCEQVMEWVKALGVEEGVYKRFGENQITGVDLLELNFEEMQEDLGIESIDDIQLISAAVVAMKRKLEQNETKSLPTNPEEWGRENVNKWLEDCGAGSVVATFEENQILGKDLLDLSAEDITDDLQVEDPAIVQLLVNAIVELKKKKENLTPTTSNRSPVSPTAAAPTTASIIAAAAAFHSFPPPQSPSARAPPSPVRAPISSSSGFVPPPSGPPSPAPHSPIPSPLTATSPRVNPLPTAALPPPPSSGALSPRKKGPLTPPSGAVITHSHPPDALSSPLPSPPSSSSSSSSSLSPSRLRTSPTPSSPRQMRKLSDGETPISPGKKRAMKIHSFVGVPPVEWTVEHVCDWLRAIGTKTAVQSFEENKISGASLLELTGDEIHDDLEIDDPRIESAILKGINLLKKGNTTVQRLFVEKNDTIDQASESSSGDLPDGWKEYVDPKGRKYYYNKQTRQKQWNKPAAGACSLVVSSKKTNKVPMSYWESKAVFEFLQEVGVDEELIAAVRSAGWTGSKMLNITRQDVEDLLKEDPSGAKYDKLSQEVFNHLSKFGQKYMVLWSYDANHPSKLSVTAGTTVYMFEEVDDEWIKVRDSKGGVGRVPLRYLRIVEKIEKSPGTKPTRSLSRNRSMKNTFAMKEKIKPIDWEVKDVFQWVSDIGAGSCAKTMETASVTGKELLEMTEEKLKEIGVEDELVVCMLERGIKQLKTGHVPRNSRQVKPVNSWSVEEVGAWLIENGFSALLGKLKAAGIKGENLPDLDVAKLKAMGIDEAYSVSLTKKISQLPAK